MLFVKKPEGPGPCDLSETCQPPTTQHAPAKGPGGSTQTVVDAGLTITGNLQSLGDVQVDGKICGDIQCAHLVVGKDGTITGDIFAEQAVVRGRVKGTIRANRVVLQDSARVESEIFHKTLSVDEGASFDGQSRRSQDPMKETARIPPVVEPKAKSAEITVVAGKKTVGNGASLGTGAA